MKTAILLSVGLGLVAGWFWADEARRRKNAEAKTGDLVQQLKKLSLKTPPPEAQLKKMAIVLNDAHKHITAVSKALAKPTL
jgi:hypothetical protein